MAAEAVEAYLESLQKGGEGFPDSDLTEPQPITESIRVELERA